MELSTDLPPEVDPWDVLALATCWPLGRAAEVQFTTDLTLRALTGALRLYLHVRADEVLLSIVDPSMGRNPSSGLALTTRRLHWPAPAGTADRVPSEGCAYGQTLPPLGRSAAYADVKQIRDDGTILFAAEAQTPARLDLGAYGEGLRHSLLEVINALCRAARGEPVPTSPAAEERARLDLHGAIRRTVKIRAVQGKLRSFPALLKAAMPRVVATPILAAICVAVFLLMAINQPQPIGFDTAFVWSWGGSYGPSIFFEHEAWRVFTCIFLHAGFAHMAFNVWFLLWFGPLVERLFGTAGFVALYILSGLGGALASLWYHPVIVAVGASGALFGLVGGLLGYMAIRRDVSPRSVLQLFRPWVVGYLAIDSCLGLFVPRIDGAAHVGGLAAGFLCGLVLNRPWPPCPTAAGRARRLIGAFGLAAAMALAYAASAAGIRARIQHDPAYSTNLLAQQAAIASYNNYSNSIQPHLREFDDFSADFNVAVRQINQGNVPKDGIIRDLDGLIARAEKALGSMRTLSISDQELKSGHDRLTSGQDHYLQALRTLRKLVEAGDNPDPALQEEYQKHLNAGVEAVEAYGKACDDYRKRHDIVLLSP